MVEGVRRIRGAQDRATYRGETRNVAHAERAMAILNQTLEGVEEANGLRPVVPMGCFHHNSDDRVQAGAIATTRENSKSLQGTFLLNCFFAFRVH